MAGIWPRATAPPPSLSSLRQEGSAWVSGRSTTALAALRVFIWRARYRGELSNGNNFPAAFLFFPLVFFLNRAHMGKYIQASLMIFLSRYTLKPEFFLAEDVIRCLDLTEVGWSAVRLTTAAPTLPRRM
jgi:hypothetical protein